MNKVITTEDVIELAKNFDVDQSDALETFICKLLNTKPNDLYDIIEPGWNKPKVYRVWAQSISDVYVDVEANNAEEAKAFAKDLDGGCFTDDPLGGEWKIGSVLEMDCVKPMYSAIKEEK